MQIIQTINVVKKLSALTNILSRNVTLQTLQLATKQVTRLFVICNKIHTFHKYYLKQDLMMEF